MGYTDTTEGLGATSLNVSTHLLTSLGATTSVKHVSPASTPDVASTTKAMSHAAGGNTLSCAMMVQAR